MNKIKIKAVGNFNSKNNLTTDVTFESNTNEKLLCENDIGSIITTLNAMIEKMQSSTIFANERSGLNEFNFEIELYDEEGNILSTFNERSLFNEAIKYNSILTLILDYINITAYGKHLRVWLSDEIPLGTYAILALVNKNRHWIINYIDFLRTSDLDHEVYQVEDIEAIIEKYGWCNETCRLAIARTVSCSGQFGDEQFDWFLENGLKEYLDISENRDLFIYYILLEFDMAFSKVSYFKNSLDYPKEQYQERIEMWVEFFNTVLTKKELEIVESHTIKIWESRH